MKISGLLPVFRTKNLELIKFLIILFPSIYAIITSFGFGVLHFNDFTAMTTAMYIGIGYFIGVTMHICLFNSSTDLQQLIKDMEQLVNKRNAVVSDLIL